MTESIVIVCHNDQGVCPDLWSGLKGRPDRPGWLSATLAEWVLARLYIYGDGRDAGRGGMRGGGGGNKLEQTGL